MEKMQCALFAIERDAIDLFELKQQRDRRLCGWLGYFSGVEPKERVSVVEWNSSWKQADDVASRRRRLLVF